MELDTLANYGKIRGYDKLADELFGGVGEKNGNINLQNWMLSPRISSSHLEALLYITQLVRASAKKKERNHENILYAKI